jgi:hypothetical protein
VVEGSVRGTAVRVRVAGAAGAPAAELGRQLIQSLNDAR